MADDKITFFCPHCNYEKNVNIPGKFQCTKCGCKFKIDSNHRMTSLENVDGEIFEVHQPNKIPWQTRLYYMIASPVLLLYGTFGLIYDDIYIPGKRSRGIHFHGYTAIIVYFVFLFAISNMVSVIIDHFDKRDNEINYKYFAKVTSGIALALFVVAFVVQIILDIENDF
jgi:hypothetical protein